MTQGLQDSHYNNGANWIWDRFVNRWKPYPEAYAVIDESGVLTYADLTRCVDAIANLIPEPQGKRPIRVVILNADPCSLLAGIFACWKLGLSAVVLRDSMTDIQVAGIVDWLSPHVVLDGCQIAPAKKPSAPRLARWGPATRPW